MPTLLKTSAAAALAAGLLAAAPASAGVIIQPKAVTITTGGTQAGYDAINMINQSGLSTKYVSGVTDFDTYVALKPLHDYQSGEWLSQGPRSAVSITFDFGEVVEITGFALWNEDATSMRSVIGRTPNGGAFRSFAFNQPSPFGQSYGPTVQNHQLIRSRYITFDINGCNAPGASQYHGCGIGEVVFESAQAAPPPPAGVPEPATWAMMLTGFLGTGAVIRRRRKPAFA